MVIAGVDLRQRVVFPAEGWRHVFDDQRMLRVLHVQINVQDRFR